MKSEQDYVAAYLMQMLGQGHTLSINDGEEWVLAKSTSLKACLKFMFTTGSDIVLVRDKNGEKLGRMVFVYGNEPNEVLSDYSVSLENYITLLD